MKIRNGFVSNSSSSSFVILGVLRTEVLDENMDYVYLDDDGDCVTGIMIAKNYEDDYGYNEISYTELKEKAQEIVQKLGVSEDEIKIYSGVQYS